MHHTSRDFWRARVRTGSDFTKLFLCTTHSLPVRHIKIPYIHSLTVGRFYYGSWKRSPLTRGNPPYELGQLHPYRVTIVYMVLLSIASTTGRHQTQQVDNRILTKDMPVQNEVHVHVWLHGIAGKYWRELTLAAGCLET